MKLHWGELVKELSSRVVVNEGYFDRLASIGIDYRKWPQSAARSLMEKYEALKTNGHDYAAFQLYDELGNVKQIVEYQWPEDDQSLKNLYLELQKENKVHKLANDLLNNPKLADTIISDFLVNEDSQCDLFNVSELVDNFKTAHAKKAQEGKVLVKFPGWEILSEKIGGFNPARLAIVLADTGYGKTNLALNLTLQSMQVVPTLYINMEMDLHDISERLIAMSSDLEFKTLRQENIDYAQIKSLNGNLWFTNGRNLSLPEITQIIRNSKRLLNIEQVVIDYDQKIDLVTSQETPEWKAMQIATTNLESIAKELKLNIILLAQTNSEGGISSSRRGIFVASTVMRFFEHDEYGSCIGFLKNRFGEKNIIIKVNYEKIKARITELGWEEEKKKVKRVNPNV